MPRATESGANRPETRAGAIDLAELQGYLDRGRQLRAEAIAGLLRRGLGGLARLIRRAAGASPRRRPGRPAAGRGFTPLDDRPPVVTEPVRCGGKGRHAARSSRAA